MMICSTYSTHVTVFMALSYNHELMISASGLESSFHSKAQQAREPAIENAENMNKLFSYQYGLSDGRTQNIMKNGAKKSKAFS